MTSWLQKQKKADLHTLGAEAGLKDTSQLKKDDLISALDDHLHANAATLSSNSSFAEYYRTSRRATSDPDSGQPKQRRRVTNVVPKLDADTSPDREPAVTTASSSAATMAPVAARTPQVQRAASRVPFPPSPAIVADFADRQTAIVTRRFRKYYRDSGLTEYLESIRQHFSTVPAIGLLFLAIELYGLQRVTLPWRHAFTVPRTAFTDPLRVSAPDLFVLLTSAFWAPTILWLTTSLFIPLIAGSLINLTVANEGRSTRRRPGSYAVDPLIFGLAKAGLAWLVFVRHIRFGGVIDGLTASRVEAAIPGGWLGIVIGSLIGVIASLYEAVLRK